MKIFYFAILVFLATQSSDGAVVRQRPAFAKPVYSNSYLPAAMQVIFHAVEQLKNLEAEEAEKGVSATATGVPATSPHAPGQHQPAPEEIAMQSTDSTALVDSTAPIVSGASTGSLAYEASTVATFAEASTAAPFAEASTAAPFAEASTAAPFAEASTAATFSEASTASIASLVPTSSAPLPVSVDLDEAEPTVELTTGEIDEEKPEVAEETTAAPEAETPEDNYATPETNHELQEAGEEIAESNQEAPEKIEEYQEEESTSGAEGPSTAEVPTTETKEREDDSSEEVEDKSSEEESKEDGDESKNLGSSESEQDERQSAEEEDDEIRFTLIGEKVSQVPRPSLTSYLRKTVKSPLASSVQQLAGLYDALSKDARKQGLAKFSGYSDEVLKTLEGTMEGGVGPQLVVLLEKAVERNELTRDDTKLKISNALNELADPATALSRDLRRLVPLRFVP